MWAVTLLAVSGLAAGQALARMTDLAWLPAPRLGRDMAVREHIPLPAAALAVLLPVYFLQEGAGVVLVKDGVFAVTMLAVHRINQRTWLVPNVITIPSAALGLGFSVVTPPGPQSALIGMVGGAALLYLIAWAYWLAHGQEALGMGIVKLQAMVGAFLGWQLAAVVLVLASFGGACAGLFKIATRGDEPKSELPFGTHLALAAIVTTVAGEGLLEWYLSFFQ